ncbi:MAG: sensor histidine kinase [Chitinophagaceae bacterium]|nr:sensor histidine kinase [Chitinophagaceae bacterium]
MQPLVIYPYISPDRRYKATVYLYVSSFAVVKQNKLTPIIPHVAGWVFFFSLVLGFVYRSPSIDSPFGIILSFPFLVFCLIFIFLFYFNTYVLIPRLYLERKYVIYAAVIAILFTAVFFIKPFDDLMSEFTGQGNGPPDPPPGNVIPEPDRPGPPPGNREGRPGGHTDIVSIILFITVWSLSTAICIIRQWRNTEKRAIQAEADRANAELSFLKAQINPHFLFNTLNNIYSLAVTKNENTAESIMKLSNIMRYVTDDIRENFVSLDSETDCMRDYIDLQRLRLSSKMDVTFSVTGKTGNKKIVPLLLMTFVENAFKHGISNHESSDIHISLSAEEQTITFFCRNKIFDTKRPAERTGIGIANTRERLKHLYPASHSLDISREDGFFTVQLTIQA